MEMNMLYDSDTFVVVQVCNVREGRPGFEIVDKQTNTFVFLVDDLATRFIANIHAWQENTPTRDEVEGVLQHLTVGAHWPLVLH